MRGVLWIVATLYPLFGILDYLIAPREWLWLLYGTRVVVTGTAPLLAPDTSVPEGNIPAGLNVANYSLGFSRINSQRNGTGVFEELPSNVAVAVAPRPSSDHSGIVNTFFADGSGRSLNQDVDERLYARMLTPGGTLFGQSVD